MAMKNQALRQLGLSNHQIKVYGYLLKHGPTPPPLLPEKLDLTRSNAYKVLDQLIEMGLVSRLELKKKLHYKAEDPIALMSLVAEQRNRAIALEKTVKEALKYLRADYQKSRADTEVQTYQGEVAIKMLYEHQAKLAKPIYFVKSRADVAGLGFESMDYIRRLPAKFHSLRYGITPDSTEAPINPAIDKASNLIRTWMASEDYTSPVEWTVSGDELMVVNFGDKPSAVRIKNPVVAESFRQLWQAFDKALRSQPHYRRLPRRAKRQV